jgi:pimeloyl-ACP methyl ester carboxylesterase
MPAVFVHGVPDTHRVWRSVVGRLRRDDVVTLSLPGFGGEIPAGFDCSKEAYCSWLLAELFDSTMKRSILALHRSAIHAGSEWEGELPRAPARGLILWGEKDPYAAPVFGSRLASRTRACFIQFAGCSHWWQLERPDDVAKELEGHWS